MNRSFVHLHCHTHYSLLDGANRIPELVRQTKQQGMNAIAITDHGNLFGAIEFYRECKGAGLNPIIGYEAYMAPGSRFEKKALRQGDAYSHLTLLAKNLTGFKNLIKLSSIAWLEGFYYHPRIDRELLEAHSEGLVCLSGCLAGEFNDLILRNETKKAKELAEWFEKVFKKDFYIEIQNNGLDLQDQCTVEAVRISQKAGIPLVATADAHYLVQADGDAHDVLFCINTGKKREPGKRNYPEGKVKSPYYVRTPEDMYAAFPKFADAVSRSQEIADGVNIDIDFKKRHFPVFLPPEGKSTEAYLRELCEEGMRERYAGRMRPEVQARLDHEIGIICRMGFASYFLIVWDFVRYAREQGIPCSARGSGCGAVVAYVLYMSHVDPLMYDLLFERFLDPNRSEAPDIDIDFCQERREMVIDYVKQKYGEKSVAQICTFGTMAAKAAIKDVGRVLDIPLDRVNYMTKWVSPKPGTSIEDTITASPEFRKEYENDPLVREWIDIALKLEGTNRNAGTHAAGVVIANGPITDYVPVQIIKRKDESGETRQALTTQWVMGDIEKIGLLKMDFLGLRTLTLVDNSLKMIKKARGVDIDLERIPMDDAETYKLLQKGDAKGVFQFESEGIRELLKRLKPDNIRDIIACTALYRPGPLEGGMVDEYIDCKHGRKKPVYPHAIVEELLSETYGVMVYQEQVMRILNRMGGLELSSAYACIKAISKKKEDIINARRVDFVNGAEAQGMSREKADEIFGMIVKFGGYGFNKCVVAETQISHAITGERATVGDLFLHRRAFVVHALGDDGKLRPKRVSDVVWNGRKKVYRAGTTLGHAITATGNHPFRTLNGWTNLEDLRPGDRIAVPRKQRISAELAWPRHEVITLAGLLSEGNTCHPSSLYFFGNDKVFVDDFAAAIGLFPATVARVYQRKDGRYEVCANTGRDARFVKGRRREPTREGNGVAVLEPETSVRSGAFRWAERLGLIGLRATMKKIPEEVFLLRDSDIELFLGRLWAGDGFIANATLKVPFYSTSSRRLAKDVQHLLVRLGMVSRIHAKEFAYRGGHRPGYTVHLLGDGAAETFLTSVAPHCLGREKAVQTLTEHVAGTLRGKSSKDTVPPEVREWVNEERQTAGLTWVELQARSGVCMKEFLGRGSKLKQGFRRQTIARLAEFFRSERMERLAESDIYWDRIESIEPAGTEDTYDLTVEDDHNFVADGIIVHNSHSAAYAYMSYHTAYLKRHYTAEFMAALLSSEVEDGNKRDIMVDHIADARKFGVPVNPPDVNRGEPNFTVKDGQIIFGLVAIKGLGRGAAEEIMRARGEGGPFKDLYDFCERVDTKSVSKTAIEKLIKAGAMDGFAQPFAHRAQLLAALGGAINSAETRQEDRKSGKRDMFDDMSLAEESTGPVAEKLSPPLPNIPRWSNTDQLKFEKEALDFYFSSHPLAEFEAALKRFASHTCQMVADAKNGSQVRFGGMISQTRFMTTKKGGRYVRCKIEDFTAQLDCVMWPDDFGRYPTEFVDDKIYLFEAVVEDDQRSGNKSTILRKLMTLDQARKELTKGMVLNLTLGTHGPETVDRIGTILKRKPGTCNVFISVKDAVSRTAQFRLSEEYRVNPAEVPLEELELLLGSGSVWFTGR